MNRKEMEGIVAAGELDTVEFKKSTAQLPRAGETLCAMLNGQGGFVRIGIAPDGKIVGQQVADTTHQDLARMLERFEPPAPIETCLVRLAGADKSVIVLQAPRVAEGRPFTYDGRPYQRVGTTTSRMPQQRYESLLLGRAQAGRRWEKQPGVGVRLEELDHEEILQTREAAIQHRRISAGTSRDVGDILDRLGLRREGILTQAALEARSISAVMEICGRSNRTKFRDQLLRPLLDAGWLEMTIPDKPRSSKQQYRTTEAGRQILEMKNQK